MTMAEREQTVFNNPILPIWSRRQRTQYTYAGVAVQSTDTWFIARLEYNYFGHFSF